MRGITAILGTFLLIQFVFGEIVEQSLTSEIEIRELTDSEDEVSLESLRIFEAPDGGLTAESRAEAPPYTCIVNATEYDVNAPGSTVNYMNPGESLIFGTPIPYAPDSYLKWIFKSLGNYLELDCWARIRTTPGCADNKLAIFYGVGFNNGTRYCGWWNNINGTYASRLKAVFSSGPDMDTNAGFCCTVYAM